jgi:hypothetical protein
MLVENMSVAERINALKDIFANFGIPVVNNSVLDQSIRSEFGRGKRSELNQILLDLQRDTEAGVLSACIGEALAKNNSEPEILSVAKVMQERIPGLLQIIDVRQQTAKRLVLLEKLLLHFENKLGSQLENPQAARLLRMLAGARAQLKNILEAQAISGVVQNTGVIFNHEDLQRSGKILHGLIPALIVIDQDNIELEQKLDFSMHALAVIAREINDPKLNKAARIVDDLHCLAKVTMPQFAEQTGIEHALEKLGISLGNITILAIQHKAKTMGLNEIEVAQLLYTTSLVDSLAKSDRELLAATCENRQYAAACGFVAKLGQDLECQDLERIGLAGICFISLRQTYYELKTNNLGAANFSESLGLIVSSIGVITGNDLVTNIGTSIIEGVKAYAGIMAIPGGQAVALPLAVCAVVSRVLLNNKPKPASNNLNSTETVLAKILQQIVAMHSEMRQQFAHLYQLLENQHKQLLMILDQGFASLSAYTQYSSLQTLGAVQKLDVKLDSVLFNLNKEFRDWYLEYIRDPLDEIEFMDRYGQAETQSLQSNKLKLNMWLLFKAKHQKVNGSSLLSSVENTSGLSAYVALVLNKISDTDAVLGMVNRYVNLEFSANLPEQLPHLPSWLLAADKYINLVSEHRGCLQNIEAEPQIINDIIAVGEEILDFTQQLALNEALWQKMHTAMQTQVKKLQIEIGHILTSKPLNRQVTGNFSARQACSAPMTEQLENFEAISFELDENWLQHLHRYIPTEFFEAEELGLGAFTINFAVDPNFNEFIHIRQPCSGASLPDQLRDVLFSLKLYFKLESKPVPILLLNSWFAYDLLNTAKRFTEYYDQKFKTGLRHSCYLWISPNGMRNQVDGHHETDTHKLIDHGRLALVYKTWFLQARPVNTPEVINRVKQRQSFMAKYSTMLEQEECVAACYTNIEFLRLQLHAEIGDIKHRYWLGIAAGLQNAVLIQEALAKLDAYTAVLSVFRRILHISDTPDSLSSGFNKILVAMQKPELSARNFATELLSLGVGLNSEMHAHDYTRGQLYLRVQHTISRLRLLINTMPATIRLRS